MYFLNRLTVSLYTFLDSVLFVLNVPFFPGQFLKRRSFTPQIDYFPSIKPSLSCTMYISSMCDFPPPPNPSMLINTLYETERMNDPRRRL